MATTSASGARTNHRVGLRRRPAPARLSSQVHWPPSTKWGRGGSLCRCLSRDTTPSPHGASRGYACALRASLSANGSLREVVGACAVRALAGRRMRVHPALATGSRSGHGGKHGAGRSHPRGGLRRAQARRGLQGGADPKAEVSAGYPNPFCRPRGSPCWGPAPPCVVLCWGWGLFPELVSNGPAPPTNQVRWWAGPPPSPSFQWWRPAYQSGAALPILVVFPRPHLEAPGLPLEESLDLRGARSVP